MVLMGFAHMQKFDKKEMHKEDRGIIFALTCRFLINPEEMFFKIM